MEYTKARLGAVLEEIQRLSEAEFPYEHSKVALESLRALFKSKLAQLDSFDANSDPGVIRQTCKLAVGSLFQYVPLLGFILRSTNVRNAFEVVAPFLRHAQAVLEHNVPPDQRQTRLILSSEWVYSPFMYREMAELPDFVLIGLPAPESSNPMLMPLAGHELGHSVWAKRQFDVKYKSFAAGRVVFRIQARWSEFLSAYSASSPKQPVPADLLNDMFCIEFWQLIVPWVLKQAEESFCDFLGVRLFGESYMSAFTYLLSPGTPGHRSVYYPNTSTRIDNLCRAAAKYGIHLHSTYSQLLDAQPEPSLAPGDRFRLSIADEAVAELIDDLISAAHDEVVKSGIVLHSEDEVQRILKRFHSVVPAEHCKSLADILNAGWRAYEDATLWDKIPEVRNHRDRNLRELVLKNIEVFEIETILRTTP